MQNAHIENHRCPDVTGVILAGGSSSRMGRDKATMELEGTSLFDRVLEVLQALFRRTLIAGDRPDLARPGLPCHPDLYPGSALGGLYTGLVKAPTDWIFAASCDLIRPDPALIRALLACRDGFEAIVPRTGNGMEPLFALYHKSCLPVMRAALEDGRLCIYDLYEELTVRYVGENELPAGWERSLVNVNTPEEFRKVREEGE